MGCDIHSHLEYRHPKHGIEPVIANFFTFGRDYNLFATLAGVRNYDERPVFCSPRGLPEDVSEYIHQQFYTEIIPDNAADWRKNVMHEWCYEAQAKQYVEQHNSHIRGYNDSHRYVSNPDWHNASYLTRAEIIDSSAVSNYKLSSAPPEFQMVLDFMDSIDRRFGSGASRIVFCFDN
ncbi:hypothetical protein [Rosistilla oblonga]|uniref:Uncharacterized protein n=1 Tax=Rosistilla oblonga TaxID=2527990 RepID=A0A518J0Z8_9BACT|nr:hypothetical protein [Rosistilla oblonga]QDV59016.1 hypothetical protein Mal33_50410 [Rosistilla oblonga]